VILILASLFLEHSVVVVVVVVVVAAAAAAASEICTHLWQQLHLCDQDTAVTLFLYPAHTHNMHH